MGKGIIKEILEPKGLYKIDIVEDLEISKDTSNFHGIDKGYRLKFKADYAIIDNVFTLTYSEAA